MFGETYKVLGEKNNWLKISCLPDNYEGWIYSAQHTALGEKEFESILPEQTAIAFELACTVSSGKNTAAVVAGSSLPFFDGINFRIGKEKMVYNGQAVIPDRKNSSLFEKISMKYLGAPYLWGGRSPFGIDCSGFTQVLYKFCSVNLLRDAYQQAEQGTVVNFIEEAVTGDLAFFNNEEGKITHVGMVLKENKIIHASGKVRIDKIDHYGIFNEEEKRYTHHLKLIKRML